jgi:serine protease SohB
MDILMQLLVFSAKAIILVTMILICLIGIVGILSKGKEKMQGNITIKNINKKYREIQETILAEILPKSQFKKHLKQYQATEKVKAKTELTAPLKKVFVLNFNGDIKATAVNALREEITAVLNVASTQDEVVVRLESGGGMVHAYGLAAAQLTRVRDRGIPLTVTVDKVAASGGYLMASVANKILAAPFAIIGSIGVIVQIPNFHRVLKDKHIDFEQLTAGDFKRTLTMFGPNTEEGREKLQTEIEEVHQLFKNSIHQYRTQVDIKRVSTGEHWLGTQAFDLRLVDEIKTSDDYLLTLSQTAHIYELNYQVKKSFASKILGAASLYIKDDYSTVLMK